MELKHLFSPGKIGNIQIKNRIVRSATFENLTKNGRINDRYIKLYANLAKGGTGLIITGAISINYLTKNPGFMSEMKKIGTLVHNFSETKIAVQLALTGNSIGPSAFNGQKELSTEQIKQIIKDFANSAALVYENDFDSIQIHAAHGYLLSRFVSPFFNKRDDIYGQNREQILVEISDEIKDLVGKNFPLQVKLQVSDFNPEGLKIKDSKKIIKSVSTHYDSIEPSGGGGSIVKGGKSYPSVILKSKEDENYFLPAAKELKSEMGDCPLMLMGGIRSPLDAEKILEDGYADFISFCRPLIREPNLPNRWGAGGGGDTSNAHCISCNSCFMTIASPEGLHCAVLKRKEAKKSEK